MKKKIREQGKQRQGSTRSRVSRSSTGEAFENQAEEGVLSRAPRARGWGDGAPARRHSKDSGLGSRRKEEAEEGRREPGRRVGKDPSGAARRTLPGPPRDTQMFRAGFRSRAGREPLKARRGCGLNQPGPAMPLAPFRVQTRLSSTWRPRGTTHSPGATSSELTAPPTNTAAESTADPGSPHGAIAASLHPPLPGCRVQVQEDGESPETPRRLSHGARTPLAPTRRPGAAEAPPTTRKPRLYPPRPDPKWPGPAPTCMAPPTPHPRASPCHSPFPFGTLRLRQAHG